GRVAIVTGASRGIGAAIAERLARDGFRVVVNHSGAHSAGEAAELVGRIVGNGRRAVPIQADVSDPAEVRALFEEAEARLGAVDVLVNNAGIMQLARIEQSDDELFDRLI